MLQVMAVMLARRIPNGCPVQGRALVHVRAGTASGTAAAPRQFIWVACPGGAGGQTAPSQGPWCTLAGTGGTLQALGPAQGVAGRRRASLRAGREGRGEEGPDARDIGTSCGLGRGEVGRVQDALPRLGLPRLAQAPRVTDRAGPGRPGQATPLRPVKSRAAPIRSDQRAEPSRVGRPGQPRRADGPRRAGQGLSGHRHRDYQHGENTEILHFLTTSFPSAGSTVRILRAN